MIAAFLAWWGQQLASLLPGAGTARRNAVLATLRGNAVDVRVRRRGRDGPALTFPLTASGMAALSAAVGARPPAATLRLPPGFVLDQVTTLPLAAERDPGRVLGYEMDRLTPFHAEDLHWIWRLERRDPARSQLVLRLTLVLRAQVAEVLQRLNDAGLRVALLVGADGQTVPLDAGQPNRWARRGTAALATTCLVLGVAAVAIPFVRQSQESRRIERQVTALRPAVNQVESLRRQQAQSAAGLDVLATQRARVGEPLAILATLTAVLPDDTSLTELSIRARAITMTGQSAAAARLIPALAADPVLRDPAFTAPVTRNDTQKVDVFSIRAEAASAP